MIITVANWKGGVGKTTLAIGLADAFVAIHEADVSIVDLDPQATASQALLGEQDFEDHRARDANMYGLLSNRLDSRRPAHTGRTAPLPRPLGHFRHEMLHFIKARAHVNLRLYPNSPKLWTLEPDGGLDLPKAVGNLLREEAARTGTKERIVIVDSPPGHSVSTLAAIRSSRLVLCPMTLDRYAFWGKDLFSEYLREMAANVPRRFVVTRFKQGRQSNGWIERLRQDNDPEILRAPGSTDPAVFSERANVPKRVSMDRTKPKDLKGIYGAECADQLTKIVNAIFREFK
jgi:cellulose biosynthesis protein BcsQ